MLSQYEEDYELDNDELMELPELRGLHAELIDEEIKEQVENPFESKINFLDDYFEDYDVLYEQYEENPDMMNTLNSDATNFCLEVINLIDEKYGLDVDEESLSELGIDKLKAITYSLYEFFVVNYSKNLKKFFVKYIMNNSEEIYNVLSNVQSKNDVFTVSYKQKLSDEKIAVILSNLKTVIEYVNSLDLEPLEVMDIYNPERYDIFQITSLITDGTLNGDFTAKFFEPLVYSNSSEDYIDMFSSIEGGLIKKFRKLDNSYDNANQ